jgi:hypothetical protein
MAALSVRTPSSYNITSGVAEHVIDALIGLGVLVQGQATQGHAALAGMVVAQ